MDQRKLMALACISSECSKPRDMENPNRIQTGTIILRGPFPVNHNCIECMHTEAEEDLPGILDYSVKPKDNEIQQAHMGPNLDNQQAAPAPRNIPAPPPAKKKRSRLLTMDPVEQALMIAEHERLDALRVKEYDKRNYWLENDEDVAFFNSVLPHVRGLNSRQKLRFRINILQILDEGVPENDNTPPESPSTSHQEPCGFFCGNCGQKFLFNR